MSLSELSKPLPSNCFRAGRPGAPTFAVLHFSATYTAKATHDILQKRKVSSHLTIERDGAVWRQVADADTAWHAGGGWWDGKQAINERSVGVEIVSFGWGHAFDDTVQEPAFDWATTTAGKADPEVEPDPSGRWYRPWVNAAAGKRYAIITRQAMAAFPDHRANGASRLWAAYPTDQIDAVCEAVRRWVEAFDILPERVIGHEHLTPTKDDPGPAARAVWTKLASVLTSWAACERKDLVDPDYRRSDRIRTVQSHLARLGYFSQKWVDGLWGPKTAESAAAALATYGGTYDFTYEADAAHCIDIATALRLVAGGSDDDLESGVDETHAAERHAALNEIYGLGL